MKNAILFPFLVLFMNLAHAGGSFGPLKTVESVDLDRYVGKWYEISKFPNWFQRKCYEATAEYTRLPNGKIEVHNTCKLYKNGQPKDIFGEATVKDKATNAKLSVTFLPPWLRWTGIGAGKYWIIDLEPNYEYVVVSEPKRNYFWILSRTPTMKRATYEGILERAKAKGIDLDRIQMSRENAIED